jgi:hypothetical protein
VQIGYSHSHGITAAALAKGLLRGEESLKKHLFYTMRTKVPALSIKLIF